ncbi:hypothetical protein KSP40_PGU013240 [Platanthera guangdongensis]|uniref:Vitamin K epoxide reductase domain-containing protein n=1 Tax=Platanthera guangdongensis TaxID=2320717 RepID=A0ABR2LME8_9ASPA
MYVPNECRARDQNPKVNQKEVGLKGRALDLEGHVSAYSQTLQLLAVCHCHPDVAARHIWKMKLEGPVLAYEAVGTPRVKKSKKTCTHKGHIKLYGAAPLRPDQGMKGQMGRARVVESIVIVLRWIIHIQPKKTFALRSRSGRPTVKSGTCWEGKTVVTRLISKICNLGIIKTVYCTCLPLAYSGFRCLIYRPSTCGGVLEKSIKSIYLCVPLPLIGMVSYGLVTVLALQQSGKNLLTGFGGSDARFLLLGTTTSMATASAYFLYLLSTKLPGASCSYCLLSVVLSFSLLFISLKDFALEEIQKVVGLQLAIAVIVFATLNTSYTMTSPQIIRSSDITLEPYETEIIQQSTPWMIALAKHLHSIGAKMYGAFWCSHCMEQKQMFGVEAAKIIDYIECFPDGAGKGRKMALECTLAGLEGFPTWVVKGKVLSDESENSEGANGQGLSFRVMNVVGGSYKCRDSLRALEVDRVATKLECGDLESG